MQEFLEEDIKADVTAAFDRRRPGRREVSPEFAMLLRKPAGDGVLQPEVPIVEPHVGIGPVQSGNPLKAACGIVLWALISVSVWAAMAWAVYLAFS